MSDKLVRGGKDISEGTTLSSQMVRLLNKNILREKSSLALRADKDTTGDKFYQLTQRLHEICGNDGGFVGQNKLQSVLSLAPTSASTNSELSVTETAQEQLVAFVNAVGSTNREIHAQFPGYEDFTLPFSEGLLAVALGATLMEADLRMIKLEQQLQQKQRHSASSVDRRSVGDFLAYPAGHFPRISKYHEQRIVSSSADLFPMMQALDASLEAVSANMQWVTYHPQAVQSLFAEYRRLFADIERMNQEEANADKMQILYAEKVQEIDGDDERALRRMRELFPNYSSTFEVEKEEEFLGVDPDAEDDEEGDDGPSKKKKASTEADDTQGLLAGRTARHANLLLQEQHGKRLRRLAKAHRDFFQTLVSQRRGTSDLVSSSNVFASTKKKEQEAFLSFFQAGLALMHVEDRSQQRQLLLTNDSGSLIAPTAITRSQELSAAGAFAAHATVAVQNLSRLHTVSLSDDITQKVVDGFNIYLDAEESEAVHCSHTLRELSQTVQSFSYYPDSHLLQKVNGYCTTLLSSPLKTTPLMKILTGLELILKECFEWERDAARGVSLFQNITAVSKWVLRWRRLELHCWTHLFSAKDNELQSRTAINWFTLHDIVTDVATLGRVNVEEIFEVVYNLIWKSGVGEFFPRIHLVKAFGAHASAAANFLPDGARDAGAKSALQQLSRLFTNSAIFFSQFAPIVDVARGNVINPLTEQLDAFCTEMTWQDATFHAVRASTEKSHLQVCRVLSKLEEGLNAPFASILSHEEQRYEEDPSMGVMEGPKTKKQIAQEEKRREREAQQKKLDKKRLAPKKKRAVGEKDVPVDPTAADAAADASHALPKVWSSTTLEGTSSFLVDLARDVIDNVSALQQPKVPQQQKMRALKLLLDTVEKAGIQCSLHATPDSWPKLFSSLTPVAISPSATSTYESATKRKSKNPADVVAAATSSVEDFSEKFHRAAHQLQKMRENMSKHHTDLTTAQARRGAALCESLFADSTQQRSIVNSLRVQLSELDAVAATINSTDASTVETSTYSIANEVFQAAEFVNAVQVFVSEGRTLEEGNDASEQALTFFADLEHTTSLAATISRKIQDLLSVGGKANLDGSNVSSKAVPAQLLSELVFNLERLQQVLQTLAENSKSDATVHVSTQNAASSLLLQAKAVINAFPGAVRGKEKVDDRSNTKRQRKDPSDSSEGWKKSVLDRLKNLEAFFAAASAISGSSKLVPKSNEEEEDQAEGDDAPKGEGEEEDSKTAEWVAENIYHSGISTVQTILESSEKLNISKVLQPGSKVLDEKTKSSVIGRIGHLKACYMCLIDDVEELHNATAHSCFVLARLFSILFKKGFCKPEDQDEEDGEGDGEGDGGLGEGTGMDDGQGQKDVTDQIENEDQLMNQKDLEEQKPEDQQDKNDDGEDKSKEVETNFQGEKENAEEDDEEDQDGDTDAEEGDVGDEDEPERKKQRTEKNDPGLDDDTGENDAQEIDEDEFDQNKEDGEEDETRDYGNKEQEIKDAKDGDDDDEDEDKKKEKELIGFDDQAEMSEDNSQEGSERDDAERDDDDENGEEDDNLSEKEDGDRPDEQGVDDRLEPEGDEAPEPEDGKGQGEDLENAEDEDNKEEDGGDNDDQKPEDDGYDKDQNIFEGGQQDEKTGEEATERQEKMDKKPDDAAGGEEQEKGEQQEVSEEGRNWKQRSGEDKTQRKDSNKQQQRSQNQNKSAMQEAVQRKDWKKVQSLNMEKSVKLKEDQEDEKNDDPELKDDASLASDDEFELDEQGEKQGMVATDQQHVTETKQRDLDADKDSDLDDDEEGEEEEGEAEEDTADQATKRKSKPEKIEEQDDDDAANDDDDTEKKDKKKKTKKSKLRVKRDVKEEEEEFSDVEKEEELEDLDAKQQRGRDLWLEHEAATQSLAQQLCEQLRLILDPTVADKLQGDYKTGKRINIKKIIPYIASSYKKDRIWLRRTKASKRSYQVLIALDDSQSMKNNEAGTMSLQAVALMCRALQQLDVGEFGLLSFGKEARIIHPLSDPFIHDSGARAFSELTFEQPSTSMKNFLTTTLDYMDSERGRSSSSVRSTTHQLMQICFVITDGQITENRPDVRKLIARAEANKQCIVLIILDVKAGQTSQQQQQQQQSAATTGVLTKDTDLSKLSTAAQMRHNKEQRNQRQQEGKNTNRGSVVDMQMVEFKGQRAITKPYLENFPFSFYLIVRDLNTLPEVLADAMRQWFELMAHS